MFQHLYYSYLLQLYGSGDYPQTGSGAFPSLFYIPCCWQQSSIPFSIGTGRGVYKLVRLRMWSFCCGEGCIRWWVGSACVCAMSIVTILLAIWQSYLCIVFLITVLSLVKIFLMLGLRV
uniref:E6 protein n=1 Tax=Human papillomavirus TaxID=10566 RepID=A0A385PPG7_9PAPI|nr:MAG: E6 protein [Human papillomavirus]